MNEMTYDNFATLFDGAANEPDEDMFVAEWSSDIIFYPDPEDAGPPPEEVAATLQHIWETAHASIGDIRAATGMTQVQFAKRFCVPRRTVEDWERRGTGAGYIRLMMAEALGLLKIRRVPHEKG